MVFRLANIQQRPERSWLVMSPCSSWMSKVVVASAATSGTRAAELTPALVTAFFATTLARSATKASCAAAVRSAVMRWLVSMGTSRW